MASNILEIPTNESLLRAWWAHRQGLDGSSMGKSAETVFANTGWARSVAGIGPYLTLFSRAGISRESAVAAVAATEIQELPGGSRLHICPAGSRFRARS